MTRDEEVRFIHLMRTATEEPVGIALRTTSEDDANKLRALFYRIRKSERAFTDLILSVNNDELWIIRKQPDAS